MAYFECLTNNDHINNGDKFNVSLTGSHNLTITASVCYINKNIVCLLGDINLGNTNCNNASNYSWNYSININGKEYTGTCRIPTLEQIYSKCAGYRRDFNYWTSTIYGGYGIWGVRSDGCVYYFGTNQNIGTVPFIEITL